MQWSEQIQFLKAQGGPDNESTTKKNELLFTALNNHLGMYADTVSSVSDQKLDKESIVETRNALRFATLCLSVEESRVSMQEFAVVQLKLHLNLARILASPFGDAKARLLASRLMSNLVTSNCTAASSVMNSITLSPSADEVSASIQSSITGNDDGSTPTNSLNWVDMMLGCARSGNREALGAVVAALHNCIAVLHAETALVVATDPIVVSTLVRQILPATTIGTNAPADAATEWISLFLEQLCCLGLLPQLYTSIGTTNVTPEHSVLLHCVSAGVDEWLESSTTTTPSHPLGNTDEQLVSSHVFLAQLASRIRTSMNEIKSTLTEDDESDPDYILAKSALLLSSEILASSLGSDSCHSMALVRTKLGTETEVIRETSLDLGVTIDALLLSNQGMKARELTMANAKQRWITTLVRLLGNTCFRCKYNQDLVRTVDIPGVNKAEHRCALHVLLSCTSLGYGCFTLREWAIVALRNVLEGNLENQALVEALEAQQPLQSPELEKMGLQVDLDRRGKVKIVQVTPSAVPDIVKAEEMDL